MECYAAQIILQQLLEMKKLGTYRWRQNWCQWPKDEVSQARNVENERSSETAEKNVTCGSLVQAVEKEKVGGRSHKR